MSGMLPGVEVARRRRASHHQMKPSDRSGYLPSGTGNRGASDLDENTLRARRSLEEKLRGTDPSGSRPKHSWSRIFCLGDNKATSPGLVPDVIGATTGLTIHDLRQSYFQYNTIHGGAVQSSRADWKNDKTMMKKASGADRHDVCLAACSDDFDDDQKTLDRSVVIMNLQPICLHRYHAECLRLHNNAHYCCECH